MDKNKTLTSKEIKASAIESIKENATIIENALDNALKAQELASVQAKNSGLAKRIEDHKIKLTIYEDSNRPTLIEMTSNNIPKSVNVLAYKNNKGGTSFKVWDNADLNIGNDENPLDKEQVEANEIITNLVGKLRKIVEGYIHTVLDICRTYDQLYAVAIQQREDARKASYERKLKRSGLEEK